MQIFVKIVSRYKVHICFTLKWGVSFFTFHCFMRYNHPCLNLMLLAFWVKQEVKANRKLLYLCNDSLICVLNIIRLKSPTCFIWAYLNMQVATADNLFPINFIIKIKFEMDYKWGYVVDDKVMNWIGVICILVVDGKSYRKHIQMYQSH